VRWGRRHFAGDAQSRAPGLGFACGLDGKLARDAGVPIGEIGRGEGSLGRRPAARSGVARRGPSCGRGGGRKGEKNQRRAPLPPGETSGVLGCRRGAARWRSGKLRSQAAMVAAARVLGF
jgi:hypothetical protein